MCSYIFHKPPVGCFLFRVGCGVIFFPRSNLYHFLVLTKKVTKETAGKLPEILNYEPPIVRAGTMTSIPILYLGLNGASASLPRTTADIAHLSVRAWG